jgi:hypothetical protein
MAAALSDGQVIAIILVNTLSSLLSIFGSSMIIYLLCQSKKPSVYNRLMFGLSSFDVILTSSLLMTPFLIPESGGRKWAHGNDQTCTMLGFLIQFGCAVPFYNMSLNVFFLFTVVYGMSEARITRWIEPLLHIVSIFYPLITASAGVGLNLYSELELGVLCWIGEYPRGCDEDPNLECTSTIIGWFYSGIPLLGSFVFLLITNFFIFQKVHKTTRQSKRYSIDNAMSRNSAIHSRTSSNENSIERKSIGSDSYLDWRPKWCFNNQRSNKTNDGHSVRSNDGWNIVSGTNGYDYDTASGSIGLRRKRRQLLENSRTQAVLIQATLYVSACLTTIFWMMILRILESQGVKRHEESNIFWLTILTHLTFPLQGFWNLLIFIRPKYLRWRRQAPTKSRCWALRQCLTTRNPLASAPPEVPPLSKYTIPLQGGAAANSSSELRGFSRKRDEVESEMPDEIILEEGSNPRYKETTQENRDILSLKSLHISKLSE